MSDVLEELRLSNAKRIDDLTRELTRSGQSLNPLLPLELRMNMLVERIHSYDDEQIAAFWLEYEEKIADMLTQAEESLVGQQLLLPM